MKLKKSIKGFDAQIEVGGSTFQLKNVNNEDGSFTNIDIHDERGKFLDEFCSGFGIDLNDDAEELQKVAVQVHDYINENLTF